MLVRIQKQLLKAQLEYNFLKESHLTDLNIIQIKCDKNFSEEVIKMLLTKPSFMYPIKSFCVSIIYSLLIEKHFGVSFYDSINNPFLLVRDKFFIRYDQNKKVYKKVIMYFGKNNILNLDSETVNTIKTYFFEEFYSCFNYDV